MKLNYHGLKVKGLKKVCGETQDYKNTCLYVEIFYDTNTGEVWAKTMIDGNWTVYNDGGIIGVCGTKRHMTMQEILDEIYEKYTFLYQ